MGVDLIQECRRSLALVQEDAEDAILYMDAGAGEAVQFNGGLPSLLELGARAICSLEHASYFDAAISWRGTEETPVEKIVILTSRLLTESHHDVMRCLRMHQSVKRCTIWTSISEEAHSAHPDTSFGLDAFHDYKNSLFRDLAQPASHSGARVHKREASKTSLKESDWDSLDEAREPEADRPVSHQQNVPQWEVPDIEVKHFPMMVCSFTKSLFVLPSRGSVAEAPLSDHRDARAVSQGIPGFDVNLQTGGEEHIPAGATLLAHSLQHIAAQLDFKFEVFTLGPLAHAVGKVMSGLSSPPEGAGHPRRPAGLVLIDRSQDLITPSCHGDSLLDRIFSSLPRRALPAETTKPTGGFSSQLLSSTINRPSMDLQIPVNPEDFLSNTKLGPCFPFLPVNNFDDARNNVHREENSVTAEVTTYVNRTPLPPLAGSLSTSWGGSGSEYIEGLLGKRTKDSVWLIRKWLQEALRQERISVPGKGKLGAVSVNEVLSLRKALAAKPDMALRHMALIQVARAAEVALGVPWGSRWDAFTGAERILMLSAGDRTQSLALQLQDIVQQCIHSMHRLSLSGSTSLTTDLLSLRDALTLAIVGYGLAGEDMPGGNHGGPFAWEEEQALKEAVVEAILQGSSGSHLGFLKGLESVLATLKQGTTELKQKPVANNGSLSQQSPSMDEEWDRWEGVDPVESDTEETEEYGEVQLKLELRDRLGEVFGILQKVATASSQSPSQDLSLRLESQNNSGGLHTGLIYKFLSLMFAKMDIPGLEHHVSGMGRFFKGGLGRFGIRQAKPKLSDQKVVLLFVIGGLNFVEVREAREAQTASPGGEGIELLLGGTTLVTPADMYDLLLGSCGSV